MTPGLVPATQQLFERYGSGRLAWAALLEPAIRLAEDGFPLYPQIARYYDEDYHGLGGVRRNLRAQTAESPAARAMLFKPDGGPYHNGEVLVLKDLARTLTRIAAEGPEVYSRGEIARLMAADIEAHGGYVMYEDMAEFVVEPRAPIRTTYRGFEVATNPPPGRGMVQLIALNILEGFDLRSLGQDTAEYAALVSKVFECAFDDEVRYLADPALHPVPLDELLSKEHAARWRAALKAQSGAAGTGVSSAAAPDSCTTHFSLMDDAGNTVSMTHSIGGASGAGVLTPGTGALHNMHMGLFDPRPGTIDSIVPGKRMSKTVQTIVYQDGEPILAVGGAGGLRIMTATTLVLLNVLDHGMSAAEAVDAPRFHCDDEGIILVEPQVKEATLAGLRQRGFRIETEPFLAHAHAVSRDPSTGEIDGGSDTWGRSHRGVAGYFEGDLEKESR